jgi:hypothetical protein
VIRERATGRVLFETFSARLVAALNTTLFEAVPIMDYLQQLNASIKSLEIKNQEV